MTRLKRSNTGEYFSYRNAKNRCTNNKVECFPNYGGRGIKFLYKDFQEFYDDLGDRPSEKHQLDRINNNGNYEKGNCRWVTKSENCLNRRTTSKHRGVRLDKEKRKWRAVITFNFKPSHIGYFVSKFDAIEAYKKKYYELYNRLPPEYSPIKKRETQWL